MAQDEAAFEQQNVALKYWPKNLSTSRQRAVSALYQQRADDAELHMREVAVLTPPYSG